MIEPIRHRGGNPSIPLRGLLLKLKSEGRVPSKIRAGVLAFNALVADANPPIPEMAEVKEFTLEGIPVVYDNSLAPCEVTLVAPEG